MEFAELIEKEAPLIQQRARQLAALLATTSCVLVRHYKGYTYVVTGFGTAESTCRLQVAYTDFYKPGTLPWHREAERFFGDVVLDDGTAVLRFTIL